MAADGRLLFVCDSDRHAVVAFDLDRAGAAANTNGAGIVLGHNGACSKPPCAPAVQLF